MTALFNVVLRGMVVRNTISSPNVPMATLRMVFAALLRPSYMVNSTPMMARLDSVSARSVSATLIRWLTPESA